MSPKRWAGLPVLLLLAACSGDPASPLAGSDSRSALPAEALPLGLPLPEARESCTLAPGVFLTRIVRGVTLTAPAALPCQGIAAGRSFGGGAPSTRPATGPWAIHVLEIDPAAFAGELRPALAGERIAGKATVDEIADARGALAAVNGGYFVVGGDGDALSADGIPGDPAGVTVLQGELLSEAIRGRTAMLWEAPAAGTLDFAAVETPLTVRIGEGMPRPLDGINRAPGKIRNCGGLGGDSPTEEPRHDVTCSDPSELIWYTPAFGRATVQAEGVEAVLDAAGRITTQREPGGPIPADGAVLAATGALAQALAPQLITGSTVTLDRALFADAQAREGERLAVLNGGPRLLRAGRVELTDAEEGFRHPDDPSFGRAFVSSPQPRTLAGRTADGRLLFVVVDGRQPAWSAGLALEDAARLMQHFGASEAMNLDGGGSSTLVVAGQVVNRPSDDRPRPVGDAVLILP